MADETVARQRRGKVKRPCGDRSKQAVSSVVWSASLLQALGLGKPFLQPQMSHYCKTSREMSNVQAAGPQRCLSFN